MSNIKLNIIYQTSYDVLILFLPLIISPYLSRSLGAQSIGINSYALTVSNYYVIFANLGLKNYGNREIARVRDNKDLLNKTFTELFVLHFVLSFISLFVFCCCLFLFDSDIRIYILISGIYILSAAFDVSWFFAGLEEFRIIVIRNGLLKIITVVLIFCFVRNSEDLWIYMSISSIGNLLGQLYLLLLVKKHTDFVRVDFKGISRHIPPMFVLFVPTIAISLYHYIDKIMIKMINGPAELGYYELSEKIPAIAIAAVGSIGVVMMPRMSNLFASNDFKKGLKYLDYSMQFVMWLSIALAFGIAGISKVFSPVFWGADFSYCTYILLILSFTLPIKGFANVIRTQYLIPCKKDLQYIISVCSGAIVNIVANFFLIPIFQSIGAAFGTIAAELTVCVIQVYASKNNLNILKYLLDLLPMCFLGIVMGGCVWLIGERIETGIPTLFIQFFSGLLIYLVGSAFYYCFVLKKSLRDLYFSLIK